MDFSVEMQKFEYKCVHAYAYIHTHTCSLDVSPERAWEWLLSPKQQAHLVPRSLLLKEIKALRRNG